MQAVDSQSCTTQTPMGSPLQPSRALPSSGAVAVSSRHAEAFVHDPTAPATSTLVLSLARALAPVDDRAWLAAVGALGDQGEAARREPYVKDAIARFGLSALRDVVSLVNAAGRENRASRARALGGHRDRRAMPHPRDRCLGVETATREADRPRREPWIRPWTRPHLGTGARRHGPARRAPEARSRCKRRLRRRSRARERCHRRRPDLRTHARRDRR